MKIHAGVAALIALALICVPADAKKKRRSRASRTIAGWSFPASRAVSQNGSCGCSSKKVCVGPRGGRYCYTSGGNKRYGV